MIVRDGDGLEVLLGRRTPAARVFPDAWVFPGGAVDGGSDTEDAFRRTAVREVREEVSIELPVDAELVLFDRLVAPEWTPVRFDTCFFLVDGTAVGIPEPDGVEIVEAAWLHPAEAIRRGREGLMMLMPPTRVLLERLTAFAGARAAIEACRGLEVAPRMLDVSPPGGGAMRS